MADPPLAENLELAGGANRTRDPLFTKQLLYQLSYAGITVKCKITKLAANLRLAYKPNQFSAVPAGRRQ